MDVEKGAHERRTAESLATRDDGVAMKLRCVMMLGDLDATLRCIGAEKPERR